MEMEEVAESVRDCARPIAVRPIVASPLAAGGAGLRRSKLAPVVSSDGSVPDLALQMVDSDLAPDPECLSRAGEPSDGPDEHTAAQLVQAPAPAAVPSYRRLWSPTLTARHR